MARGFGLDWICSTQSISYSGGSGFGVGGSERRRCISRCTRPAAVVAVGRGGVTVRARYVHFGVVVVLGRARPGPVV